MVLKGTPSEYGVNGECFIERYLSDCDLYRASSKTNGTLSPPFYQGRPSDDAIKVTASIRQSCCQYLSHIGLPPQSMNVHCLQNEYAKNEEVIVILVNSGIATDGTWIDALRVLQNILDEEILRRNLQTLRIAVELRRQDRMLRNVSGPIVRNTPEYDFLSTNREDIEESVDRHCRYHNMVGYFMRGPQDGPKMPSVVVTIRPLARLAWSQIKRRIRADIDELLRNPFLNPKSLYIELEFNSGLVYPVTHSSSEYRDQDPLMINDILKGPSPGCSIGARGALECGSMGPYVLATDPQTGKIKKCCLTAYHVVENGVSPEDKEHNDHYGIGLDRRPVRRPIIVDYPAPRDGKFTQLRIEQMAKGSDVSYDTMMQLNEMYGCVDKYANHGGIGRVIAASGHRRMSPHYQRLDWALIELHDHISFGPNVCVDREALPARQERTLPLTKYNPKGQQPISKIATYHELANHGEFALKRGRTSAVNLASVTEIKSKVIWSDLNGWRSYETTYVLTDHSGDCFGQNGDSGSAVHTHKYNMAGIMLGNCTTGSASFVTPLEAIVEDIRVHTGLLITLP